MIQCLPYTWPHLTRAGLCPMLVSEGPLGGPVDHPIVRSSVDISVASSLDPSAVPLVDSSRGIKQIGQSRSARSRASRLASVRLASMVCGICSDIVNV